MLKPRLEELGVENLGGSTRVNGDAVFLLFKIPIRFLVGDRPAGALNGLGLTVVLSFLIGERASRIGRRGAVVRDEKSFGDGGAFVRKKLVGFTNVSFDDPPDAFERFGERKMIGSIFSESFVSNS